MEKENKQNNKQENKKPVETESKEEKSSPPKKEQQIVSKKDLAIAHGRNFHASMKNCSYICRFIKNKSIDTAINDLEEVIKMKKPVPFKGEIPHRKGKKMMSGRYPIKAAKMFINLLKSLKGNVLVNQMDLDKTKITIASASWAERPMKSGGRKFKRTNILVKAEEKTNKNKKSPKPKEKK